MPTPRRDRARHGCCALFSAVSRRSSSCRQSAPSRGLAPLLAVAELGRALLAPGPTEHGHVWIVVIVGVVGLFVRLLFTAASSGIGHFLDSRVQLTFRRALAERLGRAPIDWYSAGRVGEVSVLASQGVLQAMSVIAHLLAPLISASVTPLTIVCVLLAFNWQLGLAALVAAPIVAALQIWTGRSVVERLPDGWQTNVGEGGALLSGGERQRVSIARALLKDAPIVLLDEVTSALDPVNEAAVHAGIERLMVGRTVVTVAHRMRTVQRADRVVFLQEGRIVADGSHDDLLRRGGPYAGFWQMSVASVASE